MTTRLPRTKDQILNDVLDSKFYPQNRLEEMLPLFLEVLIDIRDNLETPYITE